MKRMISILILVGLTKSLLAQEQLSKTTVEGKEFYVYPYQHNSSRYDYGGSRYGGYNNSENEIVPYPGELPDGDYIIYYPKRSIYKKKMWFFHRRGEYTYDSTRIGAKFAMKNNRIEGFVQYFSEYGTLLEEGNYINDQREGKWKKYANRNMATFVTKKNTDAKKSDYYSRYLDVVDVYNYIEGIKQGKCKIYLKSDTSKLILEGFYTDNDQSGEWKYYYDNGQLSTSLTYADSIKEKPGSAHELTVYDYSSDYDYSSYGSTKIKGFFHGWYKEYYPNGQLKTQSYYEYGYTKGMDTTYFPDGKIWKYYTFNKEKIDSTYRVTSEYFHLDTMGNILRHDQKVDYSVTFSKKYRNGELTGETYYSGYYKGIKNRDTLVLHSREYDYEKKDDKYEYILSKTTYLHLETGTILKKKHLKQDKVSEYSYDDYKFSQDKASKIYYIEEIDYKGKNQEYEIHTYKHLYRSPYYRYIDYYSSVTDSSKVMVNGQPFNGKFIDQKGYYKKRKRDKVKISNNKIKHYSYAYGRYDYGGTPSFGYNSKFIAYRPRRRGLRGLFKRKVTSTEYSTYVDGVNEGPLKEYNHKHGKLLVSQNYSKGKLIGDANEYSVVLTDRWSDCKEIVDNNISKKAKLFRKWRYYLNTKEHYENGLEEGTFYNYYCNGRVSDKVDYKDGYRNGNEETYSIEGKLRKKASYVDGWLDGNYNEWGYNGKPTYELKFEEGVLSGEYKYYHTTGTMRLFGNVVNGYKVGDWITYFEDGTKKYVETFELIDSSFCKFKDGSYRANFIKYPYSSDHTKETCYSKQYYPSGALAAEGKIHRANRSGIWKFYDEGENLIKQINYEPGFIINKRTNGTIDSIPHFGYYESWYRNGKKQSEGYVLNESTKYDCYQQTKISDQDLYYLNFWNQDGEQILTDKTGRIETYHLSTAKKSSEGEMINGLKQGYWRYWDPEGKLTSVGNYKNGKETGVWLRGDLEGMHYLDDACFDISNKRVIDEMEYNKKRLKIYVIHYKKGKIIKQNSFNVNLNKNNPNHFSDYDYDYDRIQIRD